MSSGIKPIKVYGKAGPNPPKVAMILRLLDIPHEIEAISFEDLKKESFLSVNPNGRMPAIQDPNNDDLVLWESGAVRIVYSSSPPIQTNEHADHRIPCRALRHQEQVELPCWIKGSCACKAVALLPSKLGLHPSDTYPLPLLTTA